MKIYIDKDGELMVNEKEESDTVCGNPIDFKHIRKISVISGEAGSIVNVKHRVGYGIENIEVEFKDKNHGRNAISGARLIYICALAFGNLNLNEPAVNEHLTNDRPTDIIDSKGGESK